MTLTIGITPELATQLDTLAKLSGVNPEDYVSKLLDRYLPKPLSVFGKYADDLPTVEEFLAEKHADTA